MFSNQRQSCGVGGLFGVAALMAVWLAVAAVMIGACVKPEARQAPGCQLVCRAANAVRSHG